MKKKIIILISLLFFLFLFSLVSDFATGKIRNLLEVRVLAMLPEGSYIKEIKLQGLTGVFADSIYIKGIGLIPKTEVSYSPFGILRRRVKRVSLFSPSFSIAEQKKGTGGGGVISLFYIEEIEVSDGYLTWKGHEFEINGKGKIFSTGIGEIVVDIQKLWGKIDSIDFGVVGIHLALSDRISNVDIRSLRVGNSELKVRSELDGTVKGSGRVYMSDLEGIFNIEGEGFLDVNFAYDSTITFEGESKIMSLKGFALPEFVFRGEKDSVNIECETISGFLNFRKKIYGQVKLTDFNFEKISKGYPDSKLTGLIDFSYTGKDTLLVVSKLGGEVFEHPLPDLILEMTKIGENIFVDSCEGKFNGGEFFFKGKYGERIEGDLQVKNLDVSPIAEFFGIKTSAMLNVGLSIHDKIYGAFSFTDLAYGDMKFKYVDGNLNLSQDKGRRFPGIITFVSRGISFKDRKVFELGETSLNIGSKKLVMKGLFKSQERQVGYSFALNADTVEVKDMRFAYAGGWLSLIDSFSFTYKHAFRLHDIRFIGNKGENFQINDISLSASGISGDINLIGFRPEILNEFGIVSHPFSGNVSSKVTISGMPKAPFFYFEGGGEIKIGGENIGDSLKFGIGFEENSLSLKSLSIIENEKLSNFKGVINPGKRFIDLDAELREARRWVFYPLIRHLTANSAKVTGNLKVRGSFGQPYVYGEVSLQEVDLLVKNSGIMINGLEANASFDGKSGDLKNLSASLGEGNLQAKGQFSINDMGFNIRLNLRDTPINWQYINAMINGDLLVKKERKNIRIEGDVELNRATITMEFKQKGEKGRRPSNLFLDLNFDASQGNVWIRNDMANIELEGKVGVSYEGGPLLVSGNLEVKQGTFYYLYKSFEVKEGKFNFNESPEINPNIDVKAITLISSRSVRNHEHEQDTVFLAVSGTMRSPEFDLYSKSSLSKAEIMTLLSLNLEWEDLASVKSIEQSVTETAFNYWVRQTLNRRLKDEFGIDVLEMQGVGGHYEFVVGKYVTDKLFVKARTDIQSYGISEVQAEYKLKKWGYITAEKDFLGKTRFLFNLEWRY
jgi:hypothetical protein